MQIKREMEYQKDDFQSGSSTRIDLMVVSEFAFPT